MIQNTRILCPIIYKLRNFLQLFSYEDLLTEHTFNNEYSINVQALFERPAISIFILSLSNGHFLC